MIEKIQEIKRQVEKDIAGCKDLDELQNIKIIYLGKKGEVTKLLRKISNIEPEQRPKVGKAANILKKDIDLLIQEKKEILLKKRKEKIKNNVFIDVTLPGEIPYLGHKHPISRVIEEICDIFSELGFSAVFGPEIETEYHNFQALNIPHDHPSRDVFDTFYIEKNNNSSDKENRNLLRSQTSTVQIRVMEKRKPPLKIVAPGKVYRPDTLDASHSFMFHQIEGLMVDKNLKFSHLKGVLLFFAQRFFSDKVKMRFRPHFFPFTEPSAEVDISCIICKSKGCSMCSQKGWVEILGAGMVDPNVFKTVGYNSDIYTGFAFGMGVERIAILKYGIEDIRLFSENDKRFLKQF